MTAEVLRMLEAHRSASWQETVGGSSPADFAADRAQASQSELTPSRDFFDAGVVQQCLENGPEGNAVVGDDEDNEAPAVEEETQLVDPFQAAKRRRFLPGADATNQNFAEMFDLAFKSFKESVEMEPEEQPERLRSKPRGTRSLCLKKFPTWSPAMVRLAVSALTVAPDTQTFSCGIMSPYSGS